MIQIPGFRCSDTLHFGSSIYVRFIAQMPSVRTHYWERYAPRTVSTALFRSLVESLDQFKPGLSTTSREIKSRAISHQKITDLKGPQSWHVIDSHSLAELEHLHTELLLVANATDSCELHIEFRGEHIFLSVSDIQTQWGKTVFEEARHLLAGLGVASGGWKNWVAKLYGMLDILQNVLMVVAAAMFAIWFQTREIGYLYGAAGFFASGVIPTLRRLLYFFNPPRKKQILQTTTVKGLGFPWPEATAILAFVAGVLGVVKEILSLWGVR